MIRYPQSSILVDATSIDFGDRTRKDYGDLSSLAESIETNGLIHPPVIDLRNRLIAGGRRVKAMRDVLKLAQIPVVYLEVLDDAHLAILEAEENIRRKNVDWKERVEGVCKVHESAKRAAILDAKATRRWTIVETGEMLGCSFSNVNNMLTVARYLRAGDKEVSAASSITEALKVLLIRKEREIQKRLAESIVEKGNNLEVKPSSSAKEIIAKFTQEAAVADSDEGFFSKVPQADVGVVAPQIDSDEMPGVETSAAPAIEVKLSSLLHCGDGVELMFTTAAQGVRVDHIICDPPYGIDMANLQDYTDIDSVKAEHDVTDNIALFSRMMPAAFNLLKDAGFFIFFYDLDHHEKLQELAKQAGFNVQRWPLTWVKTSPCKNQSASKNWTKNTEVAMVCRKGNASLLAPQTSCVWTGSADDLKVQLGHPFVKPVKLWQWIYGAVCLRGQSVCDPFAGVGSSTIAAVDFGLLPLAFELVPAHYDRLVINTAEAFKRVHRNPKFT